MTDNTTEVKEPAVDLSAESKDILAKIETINKKLNIQKE